MGSCEDSDTSRLREEVEALQAIFGEENVSFLERKADNNACVCIVLSEEFYGNHAKISFILPPNYPSEARPNKPSLSASGLQSTIAKRIVDEAMRNMNLSIIGEVCLFEYCEAVSAVLQNHQSSMVSTPVKAVHNEEQDPLIKNSEPVRSFDVFHGEPIVDRKSVFQAHLAFIDKPDYVSDFLEFLKRTNRKVATATHNILAFRVFSDSGTLLQDCDDDSEAGAGKALLFTLEQCGVSNFVVVVSRWYGGIKLGPVRFKHINNCARALVTAHMKPNA